MLGLNKIIKSAINRYHEIGVIYREINSSRYYLRRLQLESEILQSHKTGINSNLYCDHEIIVSLTTYGRRIKDVCFTIESLMQQSRKANRIILWLDKSFEDKQLPASLILQKSRGLEICFTTDIRSYTKLIPSLKKYPDAAIITFDDDVIYDFDILDRLITAYISDPIAIHSCRIHSMTFYKNGNIKPYSEWDLCKDNTEKPSRNFITGVGGTLYPPHSLASEVLNEDIFLKICKTADDVWFTAMALLEGTPIRKVPTRNPRGEDYLLNEDVQDMGLFNINTGESGKNDIQIKEVFDRYNIWRFINNVD